LNERITLSSCVLPARQTQENDRWIIRPKPKNPMSFHGFDFPRYSDRQVQSLLTETETAARASLSSHLQCQTAWPTELAGQTANQPRWLVERRTGTPDPPKPAADTPGPRRLPDKLSCGACLFGPAPRVARPSDLIPVASAPNPFRPPRRVGRPGSTHPTKPGQQENRKKTISRRGAGEGFRNQTVTRPPPNTARPPGRPATGAGRRSAALNPTLPRPRPRRPAPGWHKILAQTGTI
jgi:hypothetical protein